MRLRVLNSLLGPKQRRRIASQGRPLRVRAAVRGPAALPLRDQLLPDRDAVHPVRHRGRLPLSGRGPAARRSGRSSSSRRSSSSPCCWSPSSTSGDGERSNGGDPAAARRRRRGDFRVAPAARPRHAARRPRGRRPRASTSRSACSRRRSRRRCNWARGNSLFPLTFGLACCAIEMMSIVAARYDIARFGAEAFRASPRQADLLILSGRVSIKMAPVIRRIYDQMLEPKWVIAMGACSSSAPACSPTTRVVQGADKFMPVDVHVPGCPPRPEALLHGFIKLQRDDPWATRTSAGASATARRHRGVGAAEPRASRRPRHGGRLPGGRGAARVPDATGLELIAQELRERRRRRASSTPSYFREHGARSSSTRRSVLDVLAGCATRRRRATASSPACTASTTCPRRAALRRPLRAAQHGAGRAHSRVKALLADPGDAELPELDSCVELFPTADFQEREVYDIFGIVFAATPTCAGS